MSNGVSFERKERGFPDHECAFRAVGNKLEVGMDCDGVWACFGLTRDEVRELLPVLQRFVESEGQ